MDHSNVPCINILSSSDDDSDTCQQSPPFDLVCSNLKVESESEDELPDVGHLLNASSLQLTRNFNDELCSSDSSIVSIHDHEEQQVSLSCTKSATTATRLKLTQNTKEDRRNEFAENLSIAESEQISNLNRPELQSFSSETDARENAFENPLTTHIEVPQITAMSKRQTETDDLHRAHEYVLKFTKEVDSLKYVKVRLGESLLTKFTKMSGKLSEMEITHEPAIEIDKNCILWKRKYRKDVDQSQIRNEDGDRSAHFDWAFEHQAAIVFTVDDFIPFVKDFKNRDGMSFGTTQPKIVECLTSLRLPFPADDVNVTFVVFSFQSYFKKLKNRRNREFRQNALCEGSQPKRKKNNLDDDLTEVDLEQLIIYVQLEMIGCNVRTVESEEDLTSLVGQLTKSIAQAPFRKHKVGELDDPSILMNVEGGKSIRVDKSGRNLDELWLSQIECFNRVGSDAARAIVSQYPSPQSLLKAYHKCLNENQAPLLLQDILIRRGVGPLATSRRIGPELSRRIHTFFTCTQGKKQLL